MSSLINTAITGIRLSQTALSVTGHNIVNANTEGYTRQTVHQVTNPATKTAVGYLGTGVRIEDIVRNTEKYLVDQVVRDIASLSEADTYLFNVSQVNNLLASDQTNLSNYVNQFFSAMNESINDPGSLLGRQLLMTQTHQLVAGMKALDDRLLAHNSSINTQLQSAADKITSLGKRIADLNRVIGDASLNGNQPNDLLDQLDLVVRELSRYVSVNTVNRPEGGLNVFIGQGQPLVVGTVSQTLKAVPGDTDARRYDMVFVGPQGIQKANNLLTGGEVGALLRFREEALEPAIGAVGLLATSIAFQINEQNSLGMDLEGNLGGLVFGDINGAQISRDRVKASIDNASPNDRVLNVKIDNVADLKAGDYELRFTGPGRQYSVVRLSDNKTVTTGTLATAYPQSVSVDGFTINFEAGSFQAGDRFLIQPTSRGAAQVGVQITRAEEFAFASPIRVQAGVSNQGGAQLIGSSVTSVDTGLFADTSRLSPPMIIRFTSATTYDILDNSDPSRPVPLNPPLTNLTFVPGAQNQMFPSTAGGTTVVASGPAAGVLQLGGSNGFPGETLRIHTTDPATGFIREQMITLGAGESASVMARRLSTLDGVTAVAHSQTVLSNFQSVAGDPMRLSLNGIDLTDPTWTPPGEALPQAIPDPLTADFLRDRINSLPEFKAMGITASSDGLNLTVKSTTGVDLKFSLTGSGSLDAGEPAATVTAPLAGDPAVEFTAGGQLELHLAPDMQIYSSRDDGLFGAAPVGVDNYRGIQVVMTSGASGDGAPRAGDTFTIGYNMNGSADNRNGLELLALNSKPTMSGGSQNFHTSYGQLAEMVGIYTSQARVNQSASESMLRQSMDSMQSVAGVNLEEEAARLIQLEQHYNASARLITLARDLFETLLKL
ncbi:MAG TPA: flagellar hook-associated protein FlgK [Pseudohongiella sp.]|nr:flagellar hook-associated protein FlgK [Pseudohongiella sp.]